MAIEIDFLPMAAEPTALVDTQAGYAGSGYQENGFPPGITLPTQFNKGFRQGTMGMAVLAAFIGGVLNQNVLDSGYASAAAEVASLVAQLKAALTAFISGGGLSPSVIQVPFSATPVFDFSAGNLLNPVFHIVLTGNCAPSFINIQPGQIAVFIIEQDGVGGHTFTWPAAAAAAGGLIDPTASTDSTQTMVAKTNALLRPLTGIVG